MFFVALLAYPVIYIVGPGLLKGGYQVIYVPGVPLPAGRNIKIKTWGFEARPVLASITPSGKAGPRQFIGRVLIIGPFLVFHSVSRGY